MPCPHSELNHFVPGLLLLQELYLLSTYWMPGTSVYFNLYISILKSIVLDGAIEGLISVLLSSCLLTEPNFA